MKRVFCVFDFAGNWRLSTEDGTSIVTGRKPSQPQVRSCLGQDQELDEWDRQG